MINLHLSEFVTSGGGTKLMQMAEEHGYSLPSLPSSFSGQESVWVLMLAEATREMPFAIAVSDMKRPGAKLIRTNLCPELKPNSNRTRTRPRT